MKSFKNHRFVYGLIIGIILTYFLIEIKDICIIGYGEDAIMNKIINKLARQAARWSTAAKQDDSHLVAVLHANYGAGYLWALQDIATASQIKAATDIDLDKFNKEIVKIQDDTTLKMIQLCPDYGPEKTYLSRVGGENI